MPLHLQMYWEENFAECLSKDFLKKMKRCGKVFSRPWLMIHRLFNKRTVSLGENCCNCDYLLMANIMDNFNTTDLHRFLWQGKPYMHKETTVKSHSSKKE